MQSDRSGFSVRMSCAVVAFVLRQPWFVLAASAVLVIASIAYASACLTYKTQRNDLISAEKDCQKRWQKAVDAFGEDDDVVFVVKGDDRARMIAAVESLAAKVKQRPDQFDRVYHCVDLRGLHPRSIQFLTPAQIRDVDSRLEDLAPMLGRFSPVGWHALSLETLLSRAANSQNTSADHRLLTELPGILRAATALLENPNASVNVWSDRMAKDSYLETPHHFFTPDGKLAMVLARPKNAGDSFTPAQEACNTARAIIAEARGEYPDLEFGLTGLPVLETDEMAASDEDSTKASWLALAGVIVLYIVVYRGVRYPLLTMTTLLAATAVALGWATLTVGHLNILSATFAVMLIGLGDYGVLFVAHYDDQRKNGAALPEAMAHTAAHVGPGIITAAVTAALAFAATLLADFEAVAELGWIAGWGVLFCAAACFLVLPALIAVSERRASFRERLSSKRFLPALSSRPRGVLAISAFVFLTLLSGLTQLKYDANLLNMQARGLDSVAWEHELIEHSAGMTWDALSLANSREEALRLRARYEATPGVGRVVEAASLLPADYDAKSPAILSIQHKLEGLPPTVPDFSLITSAMAQTLSAKIPSEESKRFQTALAAMPPEVATARLRAFDAKLRRDLHADLTKLKSVSQPGRITVDDLPASFRERTIAPNGTYLVRAYADESLWDFPALERFTKSAQTADPEATGKSFRTLEGLRQMKAGFLRAGLAALVVIVIVLWLDFRSAKYVLLGLLPLALGLVATLGLLGGLGVPLNPANLIALPLIIGVGLDNGVHVLHDYRESPGPGYRLRAVTGRGICVAALTTILGFGTLMIARHRGMASLGLTLTLGVTACMVAALVVLPAILRLSWQLPGLALLAGRASDGLKSYIPTPSLARPANNTTDRSS